MDERMVPDRKVVKDALRAVGLSSRQADALLRKGWAGLVGASEAEKAELRSKLEELVGRVRLDES